MSSALSETMLTLLSWAVQLSSYDAPAQPPQVQFRPHSFFVENVCGERDCQVAGWYDDNNIIYIDQRYREIKTVEVQSLLVHEFVHYLQHQSRRFDSDNCDDSHRREREALAVQNDYLLRQSTAVARFWTVDQVRCNKISTSK